MSNTQDDSNLYDEKLIKDLISPALNKQAIFPSPMKEFKFAAVMITIHFTNRNPNVILIKRTRIVKNHAGEISFPGGNFMKVDIDMLETAIRETSEEVGIKIKREQVIGHLNAERTLSSRYIIYPYVTLLDRIPVIIDTNYEVEKIIDAPLMPLLKSRERDIKHQQEYSIPQLPKFTYENEIIWGATARILDQLAKLFTPRIDS
ncbi:MAG TPA: CoA pyrophosphatase [Nitrososphaeraceae archaeon]|nr:CoA pyrophosphatase [Nitrososphaeraceae archaeon]